MLLVAGVMVVLVAKVVVVLVAGVVVVLLIGVIMALREQAHQEQQARKFCHLINPLLLVTQRLR